VKPNPEGSIAPERPVFLRRDRLQDASLLATRLAVGGFLIYGVADNVVSPARMAEFSAFLAANGFAPAPFWAPLSVYAQFLCGLALIAGLAIRFAGFVMIVNFIVAIVMVDAAGGIRNAFPALALVLFGFQLTAFGAGTWSATSYLSRRRRSSSPG
jgi:putative oxidoreductase